MKSIARLLVFAPLLLAAPAAEAEPVAPAATPVAPVTVTFGNGRYTLTLDTSRTPDLAKWAMQAVVPMAVEWYPKLVDMLPSQEFTAPAAFTIQFDPDMDGVAATSGTHVRCAAKWMDANRDGEAVGAILHELVHVVQQYGRRGIPRAHRPPGWLVEGIADYVRWFLFEPQSRGAEIPPRRVERARYDQSYRVSANFLHWLTQHRRPDIVPQLNAAIREGRYHPGLWQDLAGDDPETLNAAWKQDLAQQASVPTP